MCHLGSNLVLLMLELATSLSCWNMEPTHLVPFILESTMHHVFCFFSDQIIVFFNTYLSRCLFAGVDGRPVLDIMTTPQLISFSSDATRSTVAVELWDRDSGLPLICFLIYRGATQMLCYAQSRWHLLLEFGSRKRRYRSHYITSNPVVDNVRPADNIRPATSESLRGPRVVSNKTSDNLEPWHQWHFSLQWRSFSFTKLAQEINWRPSSNRHL